MAIPPPADGVALGQEHDVRKHQRIATNFAVGKLTLALGAGRLKALLFEINPRD